jgi:hypothetical protein
VKVFHEHSLDTQVVASRPEITDSVAMIFESGKPLPKDESISVRGVVLVGITNQKTLGREGVALDLVTEVVAAIGKRRENLDSKRSELDRLIP